MALQEAAEQVSVHQLVADYVVRLVMSTRAPAEYGLADLADTIEIGVSPRATLGLVAAGRALAVLRGRDYLLPDDVRDVAVDVMAHRLMLTFDALADGVDPEQVVRQILHAVPPPLVVWNQNGAVTAQATDWPDARSRPRGSTALRRLELTVTSRLDGLLHGAHQGLLPGTGSEAGDSRVYVPGEDDVRRMDWAVTARTTVPHVRDLVADRELETWALADLSPSMDFGTADTDKRDLVVAAVGAIGFLASRLGDRFGALVLHDEYVHRMPARTGRSALYGLLHSLMDAPRGQVGARPS